MECVLGVPGANGSHVRARQFIGDVVAVRVAIQPEALCGLDAVMLVESRVGKIAQGNAVRRLMKGTDD